MVWITFVFSTDELYKGDLIGEDKYGNKYYQNNEYIVGKCVGLLISTHCSCNYEQM